MKTEPKFLSQRIQKVDVFLMVLDKVRDEVELDLLSTLCVSDAIVRVLYRRIIELRASIDVNGLR